MSGQPSAAIADQLLAAYWRLQPVEATRVGVRDFDFALPDFGADGVGAMRGWRDRAHAALGALEPLDRAALQSAHVDSEVLDGFEWPSRSPSLYLDQALNGLQLLLSRPNAAASEAERLEHLRARLRALPALLAQGRANLRAELVPAEFVDIALSSTAGADELLISLPLVPELGAARRAIREFDAFLRHELQPHGTFAIGQDRFERLLQEKHGLSLSAEEVYERGRELAASLTSQLEALAMEIDPNMSWQAQIEALKADHPTPDTLLQAYADEAARARAFVKQHGLVPIPPGDEFEVRPTEPFLRATTPLGHFSAAPPFASQDDVGILFITPVDAALPQSKQEKLLSAHCLTAIRAICLHEAVPGHHLQLWHAKRRASPLCRQFSSTLFVEGWGLYCEQLMQEAGYYDSPSLALWRLKNEMWRAVRLMVDVGLHCRGLDLESAARPLVELGGLEPNTARGEALRYTTSPTQPSSYVLGRDRIVELREQASRQPGFELCAFHDWLLGFSSISPALIPSPMHANV